MSEIELADRIVSDPDVCFGKPRIKGTRITVVDVLNALAAGDTVKSLVQDLSGLTSEDVAAALRFAATKVSPSEKAA
jgi:uncharacterized protein (DUF433 family)